MSVGNRVFTKIDRATPEMLKMFEGLPTSNINDEMNRLFNMHEYINLLNPTKFSGCMIGTAFTVKCPAGDNLMLHQALDMCQPGDVIVIDADGQANRALAGEIMMTMLTMKGCAGVVADGYFRDVDGLNTLTMPVYGRGIVPQGPYKNGPGEINTPVSVGGQVVFPGDIIVGDADGIVVIHKEDAAEIAAHAQKKKAGEDATFAKQKADFAAYCKGHEASTAKRMEGHEPEFIEDSFANKYSF